jgi:hypothetical protein
MTFGLKIAQPPPQDTFEVIARFMQRWQYINLFAMIVMKCYDRLKFGWREPDVCVECLRSCAGDEFLSAVFSQFWRRVLAVPRIGN